MLHRIIIITSALRDIEISQIFPMLHHIIFLKSSSGGSEESLEKTSRM